MNIAIVTDSTCDWTQEEYQDKNVVMVPLKIQIGDETFLDQEEISSELFYDRMIASEKTPTTSQPSPGDFTDVYRGLAASGYDAILSLHIAPVLSGTLDSAAIAAQEVDIPVVTYDSKKATSGLGLLVDAACRLRDAGATLDEIVAALDALAPKVRMFIAPDSVDNLLKGGRMTEEQAQGVAMLNIKLVFTFDDEGRLINYDKVKGTKGIIKCYRALLEEYAREYGTIQIRFMHTRNRVEIDHLIAELDDAGIDYEAMAVDACGATIATHAGMGMIGFAVMPAR